jgi:hypothetical protein
MLLLWRKVEGNGQRARGKGQKAEGRERQGAKGKGQGAEGRKKLFIRHLRIFASLRIFAPLREIFNSSFCPKSQKLKVHLFLLRSALPRWRGWREAPGVDSDFA